MAVVITSSPPNICFVDDKIQYVFKRDREGNANIPIRFTFSIEEITGPDPVHTSIELLYIPDIDPEDSTKDIFIVDIIDIVSGFMSHLETINALITGYVVISLSKIDGESVHIDTNHICFPCTSGGIDLSANIDETTHPFLTARGNENGALHFFRSELRAIKYLYALFPGTTNSCRFETDNKQWDYLQNQGLLVTLQSKVASILMSADAPGYDIVATSNILFFTIGTTTPFVAQNSYAISIEDDPESDETYLIRWINSMGVQDAILLTGELQDASEIDDPELYSANETVHGVSRGVIKRRITTAKYELETGYLTPARIYALKDMLSSSDVEFLKGGEWIPVSVTAKTKHAVQQREPESFKLTIEELQQTRYPKPNRTIVPVPVQRTGLLLDNNSNIISDNNSNTIN